MPDNIGGIPIWLCRKENKQKYHQDCQAPGKNQQDYTPQHTKITSHENTQ